MTAWLTPRQVADELGAHVVTIRRALESGEMHGHQKTNGARWRIHPNVPDMWVRGGDTRQPCGCNRITPLRSRKSA